MHKTLLDIHKTASKPDKTLFQQPKINGELHNILFEKNKTVFKLD